MGQTAAQTQQGICLEMERNLLCRIVTVCCSERSSGAKRSSKSLRWKLAKLEKRTSPTNEFGFRTPSAPASRTSSRSTLVQVRSSLSNSCSSRIRCHSSHLVATTHTSHHCQTIKSMGIITRSLQALQTLFKVVIQTSSTLLDGTDLNRTQARSRRDRSLGAFKSLLCHTKHLITNLASGRIIAAGITIMPLRNLSRQPGQCTLFVWIR